MAVGIMISTQGVTMAKSIHGYYESLPTSKTTVLTNLLQHLMLVTMASLLHYLAVSAFSKLFPKVVGQLLESYPNLLMSVASFLPIGLAAFSIMVSVMAMKIFARLYPCDYLEMNHERTSRCVIICITSVIGLQLSAIMYVRGHIGNSHVYKFLTQSKPNDIVGSSEETDHSLLFQIFLLLAVGAIYSWVERRYHAEKKRKLEGRQKVSQNVVERSQGNQEALQNVDDIVVEDIEERAVEEQEDNPSIFNTQTNGCSSTTRTRDAQPQQSGTLSSNPEDITPPLEKVKVHLLNPSWFIAPPLVIVMLIMKFGKELDILYSMRILLTYLVLTIYVLTSDQILAYIKRKVYQLQVKYLKRF